MPCTFSSLSLIALWTNCPSSTPFRLLATYLAAWNPWMVRCIKQNWALAFSNGLSARAHKSRRRWSRPQSSNPLTSLDSTKISLPSFQFLTYEGDFSQSLEILFRTIRQVLKWLADWSQLDYIAHIVLEIEHIDVNVRELHGQNRGYIRLECL